MQRFGYDSSPSPEFFFQLSTAVYVKNNKLETLFKKLNVNVSSLYY